MRLGSPLANGSEEGDTLAGGTANDKKASRQQSQRLDLLTSAAILGDTTYTA